MKRKSLGCAAALAGFSLLLLAGRLHTYHEPLERDLSLYVLIGRELLAGRHLYSDIWDHKPPFIYASYALAEAVAGPGPGSVYLLNILAAMATLWGIYRAGSAFSQNRVTGLWAAGLWTILSGDAHLQANQPNVEVFLNALLIWAFVFLIKGENHQSGKGSLRMAGFLFAFSTLYKQVTIAVALSLLFLNAFLHRESRPSWREKVKPLMEIAFIGFALWALTISYFAVTHRFRDFVDALFTYNRFYLTYTQADSGKFTPNFYSSFDPRFLRTFLHPEILAIFGLLASIAFLGWICQTAGPGRRRWTYLAGYAIGVQVAVALPGRFYPHYFQLWLPPLIVGAAWAVESIGSHPKLRKRRLSPFLGAFVVLVALLYELPLYAKSPEDWSRLKYNEEFVGVANMGRILGGLLKPGDTFYEWGSTPGLYLASGRRPPTAILDKNLLTEGPMCLRLTQRVLDDLQREPPALFVSLDWMLPDPVTSHPVTHWIWRHYVPLPGSSNRGHVIVMVRRDSHDGEE